MAGIGVGSLILRGGLGTVWRASGASNFCAHDTSRQCSISSCLNEDTHTNFDNCYRAHSHVCAFSDLKADSDRDFESNDA